MTQAEQLQNGASAAPEPTFDALPLSPDVRRAIDALGYENPTPVQLAVFEPASRGRSLVVQARTGTGKTAAFGLPIVDALVKKSQPYVQALILTPTRELALQVSRELERLAEFRGTKITAIYGGAPMGRQITALEEGAQVVVGTPGRVLDHLRRGTLDPSNIRIFVLDEADEMLSMGFAKELNAIIETLPKERQGLYFSATIPPDVERLANSHLRDPEYVTLSSDQIGALEVAHYVYLVQGDKRGALVRVIEVEDPESAIIFCNTRDETERLAELLKSRGYDADWLNGDLPQGERENVMRRTREGKLRFLVATDVAARGIDISHLTHVINADFPESAEQYVHRTGRTGRAGRTGTAISMIGPKDVGHLYMLRLTYKIRPIERALPSQGELRTRTEADLVSFLAEAYEDKTPDPLHVAVARRLLTHDAAETILAGLVADHLGARGATDIVQDAADARRAKNPPAEPRESRESHEPRGAHEGRRGSRDERRDRRDEPRTARHAEPDTAPRGQAEPPRAGARDRGYDRGRGADRGRDRGGSRDRGRDREDRPRDDRDDGFPGFTISDEPASAAPAGPTSAGHAPPRTLRDGERPRRDRDAGRAAPPRDREGMPHSSLSDWEPPADEDDDRPLLVQPAGGARANAATEGAPPRRERSRDRGRGRGRSASPSGGEQPTPRLEDEVTATESPDEGWSSEPRPARERDRDREEVPPDFQNIFLNVGRRDGLEPATLQKMLLDLAGIPESETGRIHIRDRISFLAVKKELAERAIRALAGQVVNGRTVSAEPARARD
jgi:ATP-dependent RNA helicase DeaD